MKLAAPREVYLKPGEVFFSARPAIVVTVLGSCVSATLHDPARRMGGIMHAMLPGRAGDDEDDPRYVEPALRRLLEAFARAGTPRSAIVAKLFGGGDVLRGSGADGRATVGAQNVARARAAFEAAGLIVAAECVGGARGLKLRFHTATGEVLVKRLAGAASEASGRPAAARR